MIDLEPRAKYSEGAEVVLRSNSSIWIGRDRWAVIGRGSGVSFACGAVGCKGWIGVEGPASPWIIGFPQSNRWKKMKNRWTSCMEKGEMAQ